MLDTILKSARPKMDHVIASFTEDTKGIHTGRATASLVEDIKVNHYNSLMSLKELASIAVPAPASLVITPWDKGALQAIETAIKESDLNVNPQNDGSVIRINFPPMSEERRQELAKVARGKAESARIALRNIREDAWKEVQREEKAGTLTEDDLTSGKEDLNKMITEHNNKIEEITVAKEKEIMTV